MQRFAFYALCVFGTLVFLRFIVISLQSFLGFSPLYPQLHALKEIDLGSFSETIEKKYLSQGYGATIFAAIHYVKPWHNGIDIIANAGTPIRSPVTGTVILTGNQDNFCYRRGYGKFVAVEDIDRNRILLYAHLSKTNAKTGDEIDRGDIIGLSGQSGFATAPHLHFSVFKENTFTINKKKSCGPNPEGKDLNPINYLESL